VLPQRIDFRPVIMQRTAAGIGMAFELKAEQVLYLPLLPVDCRQGIGEGCELGLRRGHRHAQDEEAVRRIERKHVVEVKRPVLRAGVIGEEADQPPVPLPVELRAEARDQFHLGVEINLVRAGDMHRLDSHSKAFSQIREGWLQFKQDIHGVPPMMAAAWCSNSSSGAGSHTLKSSRPPRSSAMAGTPSMRRTSRAGSPGLRAPSRMRVSCCRMPQNEANSVTRIKTLTVVCCDAWPPMTMVNSLRNRPKGGSPMAARAASPIRSTVTGSTLTTPGPMTRNSSEWKV